MLSGQQGHELAINVRWRVLLKYSGQLWLIIAILATVPLIVSFLFGEFLVSWRYGVVIGILALFGTLFGRISAPRQLQPNEALVITAPPNKNNEG